MFDWSKFMNEYGIEIEDIRTGERFEMSFRELMEHGRQSQLALPEPPRDEEEPVDPRRGAGAEGA